MLMINRVEISIPEGSQFEGGEFLDNVNFFKGSSYIKILEVDLVMGSESKTWVVSKKLKTGESLTLARSNVGGNLAPTTDTSVCLFGQNAEVLLDRGDSIEIITTDATSAMRAVIYFQEF